jgi:hypothetical protein
MVVNTYGLERVEETAQRMLVRYSTPKVAREMAFWHAMDHVYGSAGRIFWDAVYQEIRKSGEVKK